MGLLLVAGCKQLEAELGCIDGYWSLVGYIAGTAKPKAMDFVVEEQLGLQVVVALARAEMEFRLRIRSLSEL